MKRPRLILIIAALAIVLAGAYLAFAANTVTQDGKYGITNIVPDGSTDFAWTEITGAPAGGILVYSIQFNPSAANDVLIVRNGLGGVKVFDSGPAGGTAPVIKYFPGGKRMKLIITNSDCTFGTPASATVFIEHDPV